MNRAYEQKTKILKKNQYPQAIRMQIYKGPEVGTHQLIVMRIYDDASSTCIAETAHHGVCRIGQRRWASPSDICLLSVLPVDSFGQGDCFEIDKMAEVFTSAHCWCLNTFRNLQHCSSGNLLFTALERLSYDTSLISHWLEHSPLAESPLAQERWKRQQRHQKEFPPAGRVLSAGETQSLYSSLLQATWVQLPENVYWVVELHRT